MQTEGITRRRAIELGAAGAAAAALASGTPAWAAPKKGAAWPSAALTSRGARTVAPAQFLSTAQLRAWHEELDGRGLRATGTTAHERYVDALRTRLVRAGVSQVRAEGAKLRRWTSTGGTLDVVSGPSAGAVPVASYIPYSGTLPAGGVTGELVLVAKGDTVAPGSLAGKVALFDVGVPPITLGTFTSLALRTYDPKKLIVPSSSFARTWLGDFTDRLTQLEAGTPAAVVGIIPFDDANAAGSYFPYDGIIRSVPGVYVAQGAGARLRALAGTGTAVRVTLATQIADVRTNNLLGVIPGRSKELVVLHSHTDGPNGIEDNGPDAVVAMAQYLARVPRGSLPRTILVFLSSGHFAGGVGIRDFLTRHRRDLVPRIAAAITLEHLGAQEWAPQPDGSTKPTGRPEPGAFFMPRNDALIKASYDGLKAAGADPGIVAGPLNPKPASTSVAAWPGEGQYLWNEGAVATTNYITGPSYLLNAGVDTAARTDFARVRREAIGFTEMALALTRVPRAKLRVPAPR
jgi:hypothetical protein